MGTIEQTRALLTVDDVAALLAVSRKSVYRYADELGGFRVRGFLRFDRERVDAWLAEQRAAAAAKRRGSAS
jgi:excisionase family DNA binding protein